MQNKKNNYIDVTKEWISNANPNSHEIKELDYWIINNKKRKVDGKNILLDYSKSELECAKWLESTFGGEIFMCPRVNIPEGIKTPDFIWNGECWDLKEIKTGSTNVIDNRKDACCGAFPVSIYQINSLWLDCIMQRLQMQLPYQFQSSN